MPSDWTSRERNSVRYGYRWSAGDADDCTNDAYSIVRASIDGLAAMGINLAAAPGYSAEYFGALASALEGGPNAARNAAASSECRRLAASAPGTPVSTLGLQTIVWSAYYFQGNAGEVGAGFPELVSLPADTVAPAMGSSAPLPTNGQFNDSVCRAPTPRRDLTPVRGWTPNVLLVLGVIVAGTLVINAINAGTTRGRRTR